MISDGYQKTPPLAGEGTVRTHSTVCDDGSFSSPKECRQAYLQRRRGVEEGCESFATPNRVGGKR